MVRWVRTDLRAPGWIRLVFNRIPQARRCDCCSLAELKRLANFRSGRPLVVHALKQPVFDFLQRRQRNIQKPGELLVSSPPETFRDIPAYRRRCITQVVSKSLIANKNGLSEKAGDCPLQPAGQLPACKFRKMPRHFSVTELARPSPPEMRLKLRRDPIW